MSELQNVAADEQAIDELTKAFFDIFNNTGDRSPDWGTIYQLCLPEAIIIRKNGLEQVIYDLDTFIAPRKVILSDGTLTEFSENEISQQTNIIGNIAQRHTRYQKSGCLNDNHFHEYGHKLFQFTNTINGWKISAVLWEDEKI